MIAEILSSSPTFQETFTPKRRIYQNGCVEILGATFTPATSCLHMLPTIMHLVSMGLAQGL